MSIKRQATTELNHENWDQEDPSEPEEMGGFKTAPKEVLEKRVIRTAKRRSHVSLASEPKKNIFSGFGGFNKSQPSSFDFLAKVTNGTNGSSNKNDSPVSSNLFTSKPSVNNPVNTFSLPVSSSPPAKTTFGTSLQQTVFSGAPKGASSLFSATNADSTVKDTLPLKTEKFSQINNKDAASSNSVVSSSSVFVSPTNEIKKTIFSSSSSSSTFKVQTVNSENTSFGSKSIEKTSEVEKSSAKPELRSKKDDKKLTYYSKLKALNECVSEWIKKHVEETPVCILTPIFKDYDNHLKDIQKEYEEFCNETKSDNTDQFKKCETTTSITQCNTVSKADEKPAFSFGVNTSVSPATSIISPGFSFGNNLTTQSTAVSSFSVAKTSTTSTSGGTPFSFGTGKPFSFGSNTQTTNTPTIESNKDNEEDHEPPKVEYTPVVEENSVFDKKCKIFVKKDGIFVDKGVGTLYVKKVGESGKHQLLVRANTNLGTVLLNLILSSGIPSQRMGKNNVMLVCIPTPDAKPPPTPILIRVKTSEEADDLLEILNKYKT